jgi:hypothetical protein
MCEQGAEPYVEPANGVDIEMRICKLKNGKVTWHDQTMPKMI